MKCPNCNNTSFKVLGSKTRADYFYRRRECTKCGHRFSTYEVIGDPNNLPTENEAPVSSEVAEQPQTEIAPVSSENLSEVLATLRGLDKKLNIVAKYLATRQSKSNSKKPKCDTKVGEDIYNEEIAPDLLYIDEEPDADDIHAWAVLIASLA